MPWRRGKKVKQSYKQYPKASGKRTGETIASAVEGKPETISDVAEPVTTIPRLELGEYVKPFDQV